MRAEVFLEGCAQLAEGPVWDATRSELLWVDIPRGHVHITALGGRQTRTIGVGEPVGAVVLGSNGDLIVAAKSGFRLVHPGMDHPILAALPAAATPPLRMNDGKCDPRGRFIAGTMGYKGEVGVGTLWCFDGELLQPLRHGVTISNGLAWSSDGTTLYYIDTPTQCVQAFDYHLEGPRLSHPRVEVEIPAETGRPDGLTIDREGGLWVALWGGAGVHRYVNGRLDEKVEVPAKLVTSCTFGGSAMQTLYITTAEDPEAPGTGSIYLVHTGVAGREAVAFAGRTRS